MSAPANPFAFPQPLTPIHDGHFTAPCEQHCDYGGMELRDYFAAAALPALLDIETTSSEEHGRTSFSPLTVARQAYDVADAMLQARVKVMSSTPTLEQLAQDYTKALAIINDLREKKDVLLVACKALIDAPHPDHFAARLGDEEMDWLNAIKAAIAKAEGRS